MRITAGIDIDGIEWRDALDLYAQCLYVEQFRADMIAQSVNKMLAVSFK